MAKQRKLTAGEIKLARKAFDEKIDYGKVRLSDGPGNNAAAHIAFMRGNPAITIGNTVYFKQGFSADFSAPGADGRMFMHEMTHVWQYRTLGMAAFSSAMAPISPKPAADRTTCTNMTTRPASATR